MCPCVRGRALAQGEVGSDAGKATPGGEPVSFRALMPDKGTARTAADGPQVRVRARAWSGLLVRARTVSGGCARPM